MVSIRSKLFSILFFYKKGMILRRAGVFAYLTLIHRLVIEDCLNHLTRIVLSHVDYGRVIYSADRKSFRTNVLSFYRIPDKYIGVISAMSWNKTATVKIGNEVISWFRIESG